MNNRKKRKIRRLWYALKPGQIILDPIRPGKFFEATVLKKIKDGVYRISIFSRSSRIKSITYGTFSWNKKENLVVDENNEPVWIFNQWFAVKEAKQVKAMGDGYRSLNGHYNPSKEKFAEILKKFQGTKNEIDTVISNTVFSTANAPALTNEIMIRVFEPGNYGVKEYVLMVMVLHKYHEMILSFFEKTKRLEKELQKMGKNRNT